MGVMVGWFDEYDVKGEGGGGDINIIMVMRRKCTKLIALNNRLWVRGLGSR